MQSVTSQGSTGRSCAAGILQTEAIDYKDLAVYWLKWIHLKTDGEWENLQGLSSSSLPELLFSFKFWKSWSAESVLKKPKHIQTLLGGGEGRDVPQHVGVFVFFVFFYVLPRLCEQMC